MKSPNQKIAIVTGANVGLGYETVLDLAVENYTIVMACRNMEKANASKQKMLKEVHSANLVIMPVDTSKLASVKEFAKQFSAQYQQLDLLINNAGVMMPPYSITEDGFENQLGTNYLGHFALTGLLLPLLLPTPGSRVVTLSSLAHKWSGIQFQDINFRNGYNKQKAYGQSKLACLLFAYELDRRLKKAGATTISLAAHPGLSDTNLAQHMPFFFRWLSPLIGQSAKMGAQPTIYAATSPALQGGEYIGPDGFKEWRGDAKIVTSNKNSYNEALAAKLWEVSEEMTGVTFPFNAVNAALSS